MDTHPSRDDGIIALRQAIKPQHLARKLGISAAAVGQWTKVPLERVPEVSRITGLPPWVLRPDYFSQLQIEPSSTEAA